MISRCKTRHSVLVTVARYIRQTRLDLSASILGKMAPLVCAKLPGLSPDSEPLHG